MYLRALGTAAHMHVLHVLRDRRGCTCVPWALLRICICCMCCVTAAWGCTCVHWALLPGVAQTAFMSCVGTVLVAVIVLRPW